MTQAASKKVGDIKRAAARCEDEALQGQKMSQAEWIEDIAASWKCPGCGSTNEPGILLGTGRYTIVCYSCAGMKHPKEAAKERRQAAEEQVRKRLEADRKKG